MRERNRKRPELGENLGMFKKKKEGPFLQYAKLGRDPKHKAGEAGMP